MRIGELGKKVGLTAKTVRYYESVRLLPPPARTSSRYRAYGRDDVKRLLLIKKLRLLQFPVVEIRRFLPMLMNSHQPTRGSEVGRLLKNKRDEAAQRAHELTALVKELDRYLRRLDKKRPSSTRRNQMEQNPQRDQDQRRVESVSVGECCEPFCPDACGPMATEASPQAVKIETAQAKDKVIKLTKAGAERVFNGEDDEICTREDLIERLPDGSVRATGACSGAVWVVRREEIASIVDG